MEMITKALRAAPGAMSMLDAALSPKPDLHTPPGRYDRLIDALNRLPRPALAYGAVALIGFAMLDPAGFVQRMQALEAAPTELWWLLGAVIAGHFGAREAHHLRHRAPNAVASADTTSSQPIAPVKQGQTTPDP